MVVSVAPIIIALIVRHQVPILGFFSEVEQFFNDGLFGIDLIKTSNAQD